jgi:hypothetical protein
MVAALAEEKVRKADKKARELAEALKASLATKPQKKRRIAGD